MSRNIVKILEKNFSDIKVGRNAYFPQKDSQHISTPEGIHKTLKEMRLDLAKVMGTDNLSSLTRNLPQGKYRRTWERDSFLEIDDENHPIVKKLNLDPKK